MITKNLFRAIALALVSGLVVVSGGAAPAHAAPSGGFVQLPGSATFDVGVGSSGSAWVINGGSSIYRWNGSDWTNIPGAAVRAAVDPQGNSWVVTASGPIYRYNGSSFQNIPGTALDIGIGANGAVWITGTDQGIYQYVPASNGWARIPGIATQIAVDPQGYPWVVNSGYSIYRWNGSSFQLLPGLALDIGIGADGSVWIIGTDQGVYRWTGSTWEKVQGSGIRISVGPDGLPWVLTAGGGIFRWKLPTAPVDTTPPVVSINSPAANTYGIGGITLSGSCESGLAVKITGGVSSALTATCASGSYSAAVNFSAGDGEKTISVSQTDAAGNTSSPVSRIFLRDSTPPALSFTSGPASSTTSTSAAFTWSVSESASGFTNRIGCAVDSGAMVACSSVGSYSIPSIGAGSHTLTVTVADTVGNHAQYYYTWTVTAPAPLVPPTILAPAQNAVISGSTLTISWSASPGAERYLLRMKNNTTGETPLYSDTYTGTQITQTVNPGHSYSFWIHSAKSNFAYADQSSYSVNASWVNFTVAQTLGTCPPRFTLQGNRCMPPASLGGNFQALVGIFYSTMLCPNSAAYTRIHDVTKIRQGLDVFGTPGRPHWSNEPEDGYYCLTDRPDIVRRHALQLKDAGVEFVFLDITNHPSSSTQDQDAVLPDEMILNPSAKLYEEWSKIDGAPRIVPWVPVTRGTASSPINHPILAWFLQKMNQYPRMSLMYEGKPFVITRGDPALPVDQTLLASLKATYGDFSHRNMWNQGDATGTTWQHSGWCADYTAFRLSGAYGSVRCNQSFGNFGEMLSVSSAFNHYRFSRQEQSVPRFHGRTFIRMLERLWDRPNVKFLMINGWNEWGAARQHSEDAWVSLVDTYSEERSREMEPTARTLPSGLPRDFYYRLLKGCISKMRSGALCDTLDGFANRIATVNPAPEVCTEYDCNLPSLAGTSGMRDFNGDRRADYANFLKSSATYWIKTQTSPGVFMPDGVDMPSAGYGSGKTEPMWKIVVGDFNGDNRADHANYNQDQHILEVHRNTGLNPVNNQIEFSAQVTDRGTIYAPMGGMDVLAADFNGDRFDDILVKYTGGKLELYLNTGNPAALFGAPIQIQLRAMAGTDWKLVVGDFNGDRIADMADYQPSSERFWVHYGKGAIGGYQFNSAPDFTFKPERNPNTPWIASDWKLIFGDFNGDRRMDYADFKVKGDWTGHFWIHESTAPGAFNPDATGTAATFRPDASWSLFGE